MNSLPLIEKARAKINLTLHVGPPSTDGYHPLNSLVVFADIGDLLELDSAKGDQSTLTIEGPFANGLENDPSNLISRTAALLSEEKFDFKLTKNLPIASGIGGGSADAAATARLIAHATGQDIEVFGNSMVALGADIPVCIHSQTCLMEGKGEILSPLTNLGQLHAVLVNPGVAVSTGEVFHLFDETRPDEDNLSIDFAEGADLLEMALDGRNDLQDVAISLASEISTVMEILNTQKDCQLARMSGSGATCFGLFPSHDTALKAQENISKQHPDWWCVQTVLGDKV